MRLNLPDFMETVFANVCPWDENHLFRKWRASNTTGGYTEVLRVTLTMYDLFYDDLVADIEDFQTLREESDRRILVRYFADLEEVNRERDERYRNRLKLRQVLIRSHLVGSIIVALDAIMNSLTQMSRMERPFDMEAWELLMRSVARNAVEAERLALTDAEVESNVRET